MVVTLILNSTYKIMTIQPHTANIYFFKMVYERKISLIKQHCMWSAIACPCNNQTKFC